MYLCSIAATVIIWLSLYAPIALARNGEAGSLGIRVYTHNIRTDDQPCQKNEKPWSIRAPLMIQEMLFAAQRDETFIFMQEAQHEQLMDVLAGLNSNTLSTNQRSSGKEASHGLGPAARLTTEDEWTFYGVGRDDNKTTGEYSPILYRPSVWDLKAWDTVWYCDNERCVGCLCWEAKVTRILTITLFEHRATGRQIVAMNTHLDNESHLSRNNSVKVIQQQIKKWSGSDSETQLPFFVGGDFNSPPTDEAYKMMTAEESPTLDLKHQVGEARQYGDNDTYTGFTGHGDGGSSPGRIDFLFLGPKLNGQTPDWTVSNYGCLPHNYTRTWYEGQRTHIYMSDHRAVVGDIHLNAQRENAAATLSTDGAEQKVLERQN